MTGKNDMLLPSQILNRMGLHQLNITQLQVNKRPRMSTLGLNSKSSSCEANFLTTEPYLHC